MAITSFGCPFCKAGSTWLCPILLWVLVRTVVSYYPLVMNQQSFESVFWNMHLLPVCGFELSGMRFLLIPALYRTTHSLWITRALKVFSGTALIPCLRIRTQRYALSYDSSFVSHYPPIMNQQSVESVFWNMPLLPVCGFELSGIRFLMILALYPTTQSLWIRRALDVFWQYVLIPCLRIWTQWYPLSYDFSFVSYSPLVMNQQSFADSNSVVYAFSMPQTHGVVTCLNIHDRVNPVIYQSVIQT